MPPILFADNFLAGSLLTILVPIGLVVAITLWYNLAVKRVPKDTPTTSASLPAPEVVEAAGAAVSEVTPADSPPSEP